MTSSLKTRASAKSRPGLSRQDTRAEKITWTFLTNHTHVLLDLYRHPDRRLRDVAIAVGITERMVQRIIAELVKSGYVKILKDGRRNHYVVNSRLRLRHPLETHHTIGELLHLLT